MMRVSGGVSAWNNVGGLGNNVSGIGSSDSGIGTNEPPSASASRAATDASRYGASGGVDIGTRIGCGSRSHVTSTGDATTTTRAATPSGN